MSSASCSQQRQFLDLSPLFPQWLLAPSWFSSLLQTRCRYTKHDCLKNVSNFIPYNQFKRLGLKTNKLKPHSSFSSAWFSHPPFCPHTQEYQWSLQVWQCQQSVQCQPEHPQVCPTATGFSSSCSKASYPRKCILKDCVKKRQIKHP